MRRFFTVTLLVLSAARSALSQGTTALTSQMAAGASDAADGTKPKAAATNYAVSSAVRVANALRVVKRENTNDAGAKLNSAMEAIGKVLAAAGDAEKFKQAVEDYARTRDAMLPTLVGETFETTKKSSVVETAEPPASLTFTFGLRFATNVDTSSTSFMVGTNLLGKLAGSVFDAIGADPLKEYFSSKVALNTGIPVSAESKFSLQAEFGLGTYDWERRYVDPQTGAVKRVKRFRMSPSIVIEQLDTADVRIPTTIRALKKSQTWSAPALGFSFLTNADRPSWSFTVAMRVPQYYPGSPADAIGAIFGGKRGDFVGDGHAELVLGISRRFNP